MLSVFICFIFLFLLIVLSYTLLGYIIFWGENMEKKKQQEKTQKIKTTKRTEEEKKALTKRLHIIEGQIRGISQMVEKDRYCGDLFIQLVAVEKALKSLGNQILTNHLKNCVISEIKKGNEGIIEEVIMLMKQLQ